MTKTLFFSIISEYRRRSIPAGTRRGDAGGIGGAQRHDSGGGAGESAGLTKMAATMERFVAVVKQYPGQQQVDLVEIEVPGSWFGAGPMGSLTATEQREKYKAQAVEYAEVHCLRISGFFFARARQASGFRGNRWCCQGANECSLTCSS